MAASPLFSFSQQKEMRTRIPPASYFEQPSFVSLIFLLQNSHAGKTVMLAKQSCWQKSHAGKRVAGGNWVRVQAAGSKID